MIKFYIAPSKLHLRHYSLESDCSCEEKHPFEKAAEAGLAEECEKTYGKKRVKLVGYGYTQYNENGWSYYPVQLSVGKTVQGIDWIKWRRENNGGYFNLIITEKGESMELPGEFHFCSSEESSRLSSNYRQPCLPYDILAAKQISAWTSSWYTQNTDAVFLFIYEFRRQITQMLTELAGTNELYKLITQVMIHDAKVNIERDGYTYSVATIQTEKVNVWDIMCPEYNFVIRWKSNTGKEYIKCTDPVGAGDITFEFSPVVPEGYDGAFGNDPDEENIISKEGVIEFLRKNDKSNRKPIKTGTSFPVYMNSASYPHMIHKIQFAGEFPDAMVDKMFYVINDFVQSWNKKSGDKIHDFDLTRKSENEVWLHIDFGKADPEAVQLLLDLLDREYDIERIDFG